MRIISPDGCRKRRKPRTSQSTTNHTVEERRCSGGIITDAFGTVGPPLPQCSESLLFRHFHFRWFFGPLATKTKSTRTDAGQESNEFCQVGPYTVNRGDCYRRQYRKYSPGVQSAQDYVNWG